MATFEAILDRLALTRGAEHVAPQARTYEEEAFQIRAIANEDVFLFAKTIDNSQIVRQPAPLEGRACWRMIGGSLFGAVILIGILLPTLYGAFAGYKLEGLRQERTRLGNERAALDLREARLMSPQHLKKLADDQHFNDPAPNQIVYFDARPDGAVAINAHAAPAQDQAR